MPVDAAWIPPVRRTELLIKPIGEDGQHVVKDPRTGGYFNLAAQEAFLLLQLDGKQSAGDICSAFETRFAELIAPDDVEQFVELAKSQGFVERSAAASTQPAEPPPAKPLTPLRVAKKVLFFRRSVFDPDRLFTWLAPKIAVAWSALFFWVSLAVITVAGLLLWTNWNEYAEYLPETLSWETILLAWVILCVVTTGHEFAHGLTCKHYGGEVHEVGFMMMLFMPCFYCNVSDAWLIKEKSRRLWVTLAGSYFDLCLWALAVVVWRVTLPSTLPYHVAWVVMSICGGRVFINVNPLVKLDGYYLASDWLEIPNLRQRAMDQVSAHLRWVLWGAPRPESLPRGTLLFVFGAASWSFTLFYVGLMLFGMHQLFLKSLGVFGILLVAGLAWMILPALISGLFEGEVIKMLQQRWKRTAIWIGGIVGVAGLLCFIHIDDWVSGTFKTRATVRAEIRAPVNGFLRIAYGDEGQRIAAGVHLAIMEIPDLTSKLTQKQAEEREVEAKLRLLEVGARPEEVAEQKQRLQRAKEWRDLAEKDLQRKKTAFKEELSRLDETIAAAHTQFEFNTGLSIKAKRLVDRGALPRDQFDDAQKQVVLSQAQLLQVQAQKREREALGTLEPESELAKRDKEHADAFAVLKLLEAGSRPEEIQAEKSRLARVKEERIFLEKQQEKLRLTSPVSGVIITPHLMEKVGQYFKEGDLICEIEEPASMEIEIPLEEQEIERVAAGMRVDLKPRSMPFQTVNAKVTRIAPQATVGKVQSTINVCCQPESTSPELVANMTGYARIYCERSSLAGYVGHRMLRYFRTEIWW